MASAFFTCNCIDKRENIRYNYEKIWKGDRCYDDLYPEISIESRTERCR